MITKLYNLKKIQLEQQLIQKQQLVSRIFEIDTQVENIEHSISTTGVKMFGSIGDFKVLAIHKNSMKYEKEKLLKNKKTLAIQVEQYDKVLVELQKELEQYGYIIKQDLKARVKKQEKNDELITSDYVQAKWMAS